MLPKKYKKTKAPVINIAQTELLNSTLIQEDKYLKTNEVDKDKENLNRSRPNPSRRVSIVNPDKDPNNTQKNGSTGGSSSRDQKLVNIPQNAANQT